MQALDPLSTHLPQLERMIQDIENEQFQHLNQLFTELDRLFGLLFGTYAEELEYLAAHEPQNEVAERIGDQFAEMRPFVVAVHDDLSLGEYAEALENLKVLKEQSGTLFALFDEYKEKCRAGPRYSEVPYTQELLRVCHHYLSGDLSLEAVQGRLDVFCQYHEQLETQLSILVPSPPERQTFEERLPDLEEALSIQLQAIEDLDLALERNDEESMRETMTLFKEASEALVDVYKHLQQADLEPRRISCFRCGADNSIEARICGECNAVLPQSAAGSTPVSTIALEEDGTVVAPGESEVVARLQQATDQALGSGDTGELLEQIAVYETTLERNRRRFEKMEEPPPDIPAHHAEILSAGRETFAKGLSELEEGLALLREGAEAVDSHLLTSGMERLRMGEALFREFQEEFRQAESLESR